jgi:murein L,D-transpeptidase YafK
MRRLAALAVLALVAGCATQPPEPAKRVIPQVDFVPADFVLVDKSDRTLALMRGGEVVRTYFDIALGDAPVGHKRFQGDEKTPEGRYTIDYRNPQSSYHLSLHISYPNSADRAHARGLGRSPGGDIFIHGQPNGWGMLRIPGDWTDGCIALRNDEIEEIWGMVPDGTPIEIRP